MDSSTAIHDSACGTSHDIETSESPTNLNVIRITSDSGNYTFSSNPSDISLVTDDDEPRSSSMRFQLLLKEKEQSLFLAMQDLRKLRSELERISKSEQWYKQELRSQKTTRLETLERIYVQERKYIQENQRLQQECVRLYAKCSDMENELVSNMEKDPMDTDEHEQNKSAGNDFEISQQLALIDDQKELIVVLRKQKKALLSDLERLAGEKDEKLIELQRELASMEFENTQMTAKCKRLLDEKVCLEDLIKDMDANLNKILAEKEQLQNITTELREAKQTQEEQLVFKEAEIQELQKQFAIKLRNETNADQVHQMSLDYHAAVNEKTCEIASLKMSMAQLEQELAKMEDLQADNEEQERLIDHLNFRLDTQQYELNNLKRTDSMKVEQIKELQLNIDHLHGEHAVAVTNLKKTQATMKRIANEHIILNEKYANMCALVESAKFELELHEIDKGKLKYQSQSDANEIEQLRIKLMDYLHQTSELSAKINKLENDLNVLRKEKSEMGERLIKTEQKLAEANKRSEELKADLEAYKNTDEKKCLVDKNYDADISDTEFSLENDQLHVEIHLGNEFEQNDTDNFDIQFQELGTLLQEKLDQARQCNTTPTIEKYRIENEILKTELATSREKKSELEHKLCQEQEMKVQLQESLKKAQEQTIKHDSAIQTERQMIIPEPITRAEELFDLNFEIRQLKQQLREAQIENEKRRSHHLTLIQNLLTQQTDKVKQIHVVETEWQELLSVINETQKLEEEVREELQIKTAELDELNELFADQNVELHKLQKVAYQRECQQDAEFEKLKNTFQEQLDKLQAKYDEQVKDNDELETLISTLKQNLTEDFAAEITSYKSQLKQLRGKLQKMSNESEQNEMKMIEMSYELDALKHCKSSAAGYQPEVFLVRDASVGVKPEDVGIAPTPQMDLPTDSEERLEILRQIFIAEYERKLQRHDANMRTLLANMKLLKRGLKDSERKNAQLCVERGEMLTELSDMKLIKRNLDEMRIKYEESHARIKTLEQTLVDEREKFESSDLGKSTLQQQEGQHEESNLIDDYKKLIQQSASETQRQGNSAILDLIERSHQCVPNLNKLESSVFELRNDVQQFIARYKRDDNQRNDRNDDEDEQMPSLMEELRAAGDGI